MDSLIRCPRCWKHVPEQARFCPRCGSGLTGGKAAYSPAPVEPPRPPERTSGGGASTFLLFLLLSALGTVGMLVFGLTTRAPVLVRPAAPPAQFVPGPNDPATPYNPSDDSDRNSYTSGPNDSATRDPSAAPAPVYPARPRFIYPSPPMPSAPPRVHERRHERDRDDGWGR